MVTNKLDGFNSKYMKITNLKDFVSWKKNQINLSTKELFKMTNLE